MFAGLVVLVGPLPGSTPPAAPGAQDAGVVVGYIRWAAQWAFLAGASCGGTLTLAVTAIVAHRRVRSGTATGPAGAEHPAPRPCARATTSTGSEDDHVC